MTTAAFLSSSLFCDPVLGPLVRFDPVHKYNVVGYGAAARPLPGVILTLQRKVLGREDSGRDRGKRAGEGGNAAERGSRIMVEFEDLAAGRLTRDKLTPSAARVVRALELVGITIRAAEAGIWSKALNFATRVDLIGEASDGAMCVIEVKSTIHENVKERCGAFKRACRPLRGRTCTSLLKYHLQAYLCADTIAREYGVPREALRSIVVCEDDSVYISDTPVWLVDLWSDLHAYMLSTMKRKPATRKPRLFACPHCIRIFCSATAIPKHIRRCHVGAPVPSVGGIQATRGVRGTKSKKSKRQKSVRHGRV